MRNQLLPASAPGHTQLGMLFVKSPRLRERCNVDSDISVAVKSC